MANYANPKHPELEEFGEASLIGNRVASSYVPVDWLTPKGLSTWGDGRTIILGTKGMIELRKYVDVGRERRGDNVYIVDETGERFMNASGKVGFPYFGALILDCLEAQANAKRIT